MPYLFVLKRSKVPSEDEQKEFNRRYSRDLQKRKSRSLRGDKDETEEEEEEEKSSRSRRLHNNSNAERSTSSTRRKHEEEELTPLSLSLRRRSTRATGNKTVLVKSSNSTTRRALIRGQKRSK